MRTLVSPLLPALLLLTLGTPAAAAAQTLVLKGATLIDGTERPPQPDAVVVIRNGWITAVGNAKDTRVPAGARVVDLSGRYLLPGFIEMHGHVGIGAWEVDSSGPKRQLVYA